MIGTRTRERVVSVHWFAWTAETRMLRLRRAQAAVTRALAYHREGFGFDPRMRADAIVGRSLLERFEVGMHEVVGMRRATRDERGRWVVTARPAERTEDDRW